MRKTFLLLAASTAIISSLLGTAPVIGDAETTTAQAAEEKEIGTQDGLHIKVESDDPGEIEFDPGAEIPVNVRIKNEGTEDARVFFSVEVPTISGILLLDGADKTPVLEFSVGNGWSEITDGVYAYDELLPAGEETTPLISSWVIPEYNLSFNKDGDVISGSVTVEDLGSLMNEVKIQGYSIQGSMKGTPDQLWKMVSGE